MNIVRNGEIELLLRKLPEELILRHHSFDDLLAQKLLANLKLKKMLMWRWSAPR